MRTHTSIKFPAKLAAVVILGAAILGFTGCYYIPGFGGRPARANISMSRAALPANVASIALIVGGPGMDTIAKQYPVGTTKATLTIPSGLARTFTLLANTPSVTLRGDATVDLAPGETKDIVLTPTAAASQIIVPDYLNYQLAQISDMSGTGWTALPDLSAGLNPYDVDFDDQGRIYVADYYRGILWVDDITGTFTALTGVAGTNIQSIAIDRKRGLLYYVGDVSIDEAYELRRIQLATGTDERVQVETIYWEIDQYVYLYSVTGIAVDSDGFVYVANNSYSSPSGTILKIDPNPASSPTLVASSSYTFSNPWDVLVNGDYIYVSDQGDLKIVRLTKDLKFVDSFSGQDPFLGPERFVAILNKPITLIDESSSGSEDRLVSFNDMTGAGWTTYGSSGSGQGQFLFYSTGAC